MRIAPTRRANATAYLFGTAVVPFQPRASLAAPPITTMHL
jgi:hypothetical protein